MGGKLIYQIQFETDHLCNEPKELILEKDSNFVKQTHHCAHKKAQNLFPYIYGINHINICLHTAV